MPYRNCTFSADQFYHLFNRGNDRQRIFTDESNYHHFLRVLRTYLKDAEIELSAYCLMPNHYHLLIYLRNDTDVSSVMQAFTISYVKSFNVWSKKSGHLFGGPFRAVPVESEAQLTHLCGYIHLNPVMAGLVRQPQDWIHSDYREWVSHSGYLKSSQRLRYELFGTDKDYRKYIKGMADERQVTKEFKKILID